MQSSCNASSFPAFSLPGLDLQCCPQLREMAVASDLPQAGLDEAQRTGHSALFLVRRASVIHIVGELAELRIQGFQTVGGLQAHPPALETAPGHGGSVSPPELRPRWPRRRG